MAWANTAIEGIDGEDFINIYSKGRTQLGIWLSHFTESPVEHPQFGRFRSLEAGYYWLSTGKQHNQLRHLHGYMAKSAGQSFTRVENANFDAEFAELIQLKLDANPEMRAVFVESTLPFRHFYEVWSGGSCRRIKAKSEDWVVGLYEHARFINQGR